MYIDYSACVKLVDVGVRNIVKNDKDLRKSNKLKRLERLKEEELQRSGKHRFAEEFSDEPLSEEHLELDTPDHQI